MSTMIIEATIDGIDEDNLNNLEDKINDVLYELVYNAGGDVFITSSRRDFDWMEGADEDYQ